VAAVHNGTVGDAWTSLAVVSNGEYGVPQGLQFGFPVRANGQGGWTVVEGLTHDEFATERIRVTTEELQAERADVESLLP
ncbi:MAG TPA: malate dehydrogenase, partial [Acidimicrobiales bacterium]